MEFVKNIRGYETDPEIKMYRQEEMTVPHMVSAEEVQPDESGRKIVPIGSLVDKDGKVCKISQSGEITGTPVGITHDTKDVTNGNQECAVYIHGHLKGPMLQFEGEEYQEAIGKAIEKALPGIYVYPRMHGPLESGGSGGSSSSSVDLSKATGTLTVEHGGTGATSAEAALTALGGAKDSEFQKVKATVEKNHQE